jgi:hypothetical protein
MQNFKRWSLLTPSRRDILARLGAHSLLRAPFGRGVNLDNFCDLAMQINICEALEYKKKI